MIHRSRPGPGLRQDRRGAVAILFALAMPVLIGFAALATEVGIWYLQKRMLQTVADVAAMSAAYELLAGSGAAAAAAAWEAERHGAAPGPNRDLLVNTPPVQGAAAGDADAVEILIQERRALLFAGLFSSRPVTLAARAVARVAADGAACVLALDAAADRAVDVAGTASLIMQGCMIAANSESAEAISIRGNAEVAALSLVTAGDYAVHGAGALVTARPPRTGMPPVRDPYADRSIPPPDHCDQTGFSQTSRAPIQLPHGTYCDGLSLGGQSVVDLEPGVFVVRGGSVSIHAGATLGCSGCTGGQGVTFILTGSGTDYATVHINGNVDIKLRAPQTGPYAGLLFFQDPDAPSGGANIVNGGAEMNLQGALYFPSQPLEFRGNSGMSGAGCTQLVARTVGFTGSSDLGSDCAATGATAIDVGGTVALVE